MDIVYAAEKRSIAELLADHVRRDIGPEEIDVTENPSETGSFFIGWGPRRYVLSPAGHIVAERSHRLAGFSPLTARSL